jgi:short-subunit dehydrogenase
MAYEIAPPGAHVAITGASSGIGAALARAYAVRPNIRLLLIARDPGRLDAVAAACRASGAIVATAIADVTDSVQVDAALETADDAAPIDILICNAGIGGDRALAVAGVERTSDARAIATVNFSGVVFCVSALADRFVKRRAGHVVLVSSVAARIPLPMAPTYAASKAGISAYARSLRMTLRPHGVAVTLVEPGFVVTPMSDALSGPKPFAVSAEAAASRILSAIDGRRASLCFPWPMRLLMALARCMPDGLLESIMRRASQQ